MKSWPAVFRVSASPLVIFIFQLNWASDDLLLTALESWREACISDSKTIFSPLVVVGSTYCVSGSFKPPPFFPGGSFGVGRGTHNHGSNSSTAPLLRELQVCTTMLKFL